MKSLQLLFIALLFSNSAFAYKKEQKSEECAKPIQYSTVINDKTIKLRSLVDKMSSRMDKKIFIDAEARSDIVVSNLELDSIDFNEFLMVMNLNGMAAVEIDNVINLVPADSIKQYPVPFLKDDEKATSGNLWVSKLISADGVDIGHLVPLLRSLIHYHGHLAYHHPSNKLLVVAPWYKIQQIEQMVSEFKPNNKN